MIESIDNLQKQDLENLYKVNEQGRITNPGKFEGEPLYVPYFNQFSGQGDILTTLTEDGIYQEQFDVNPQDVEQFPELENFQSIIISENEQGFVGHELVEKESQPDEGCGIYCVSVFLVDRAYGGPEEGGWWYDTGEPVLEKDMPLPRFTTDQDEAIRWREEMQKELDDGPNKGRYPISSVLSQGMYQAGVTEGMPAAYPKVRPRYE